MNSNQLTDKFLFISRPLGLDSVFHQLKTKGWKICDKSLLKIEYRRIDIIPASDWIFFYSPNGVRAFAQNIERLNFHLNSIKIAAYGPGTAVVVKSFNWNVDFIGTGEAETTLQDFNIIASGSSVLFPMALHSKHALLASGNNTFSPIDLVVYENSLNPTEILPCNVYIFTSSLNVKSFFVFNDIQESAQVIAIGRPTADTLAEYYQGKINVPSATTESELFKMIKESI
ncbi:MAG: uroporphyrinogen-III synthase [Saprospiraceae bacterium]|nr:uroporphyrinogen-III synthase [Saprospiraceae bacterium]